MAAKTTFLAITGILILVLAALPAAAQSPGPGDPPVLGIRISAGGRYDDVRMCVASPPGTKGGPAVDVSFYLEAGLSDGLSLTVDIPVLRPILFWAAFDMLQFEPEAALLFRGTTGGRTDWVAGPSLGMIFHYGPDYASDSSGAGRGPSFFAMGPKIGGYFGLDFKRPGERFNVQLGLSPYVSPLWGIGDPEDHRGVVAGATLDGVFRFH